MEPILTIDNLNSFGGNMLRQGDKSQLKYRLRDVGNKNLAISSKPCQVKMYGRNYTTVVYETSTTVSSDNTVSFTINKILPKGTFYLEFTVGDYIFPTDHREFFEITPSGKGMEANIIEIVGKDVLINAVKSQVDAELQPLVTSLESAEQAEIQRATAESSRVSAEAQRVTDHANRSAELAGKADKVVIKNLASLPIQVPYVEDFEGETSDVWYAYVEARITRYNSGRVRLTLRNYGSSANVDVVEFTKQVSENFEAYSLRASGKIDGTRLILSSDLSPDLEIDIRNLTVLNLTKTFGAGNEPTKEEMDELIKVTGYIDGEYALNNKEMLGHLMKGIRDKADKKQEDWITPTLLNGWIENNPTATPVGYMKDSMGFVHLKGRLTGSSSHAFVLPPGYRPNDVLNFPANNNRSYGSIEVNGAGWVYPLGGETWISLSGTQFKAER